MINKFKYTKELLAICAFLMFSCSPYEYNFEDGYDTGADKPNVTVDTTGFNIDKSMYERARVFPGLVDSTEVRLQDAVVSLDLSKQYIPALKLGIQVVPQAIISTGLYAAPGELIEINVPSGIYGLTVQIGSHTDNLTAVTPAKRDPIIYTVATLFPGTNRVRNPYGGYIWIKPKTTLILTEAVSLRFKGAVKAPDYELGTTTSVAQWKQDVLNSKVPWLELRSKYAAFSLPREFVKNAIDNGQFDNDKIIDILNQWDVILLENFYKFNGLSLNNNDLQFRVPEYKQRFILDAQLEGGVYVKSSGQPIVAQYSQYWFDEWTDFDKIRKGLSVGTFTVLGNNFKINKSPYWSYMTTSYFSLYKTASQNGFVPDLILGESVNTVFPKALAYAVADSSKTMQKDGVITPVFSMLPFIQLFEKVSNPTTGGDGWTLNAYMINDLKKALLAPANDLEKHNYLYNALSDYTQKDFASFFDAWGIPISDYWRETVRNKYLPLNQALWEYNPITKTGGTRSYTSPYIYHVRTDWEFLFPWTPGEDVASGDVANGSKDPKSMLDSNYNTYWHAKYQNVEDPLLPHSFIIDTHATLDVDGIYITAGGNAQKPQQARIDISNDGITYTTVGTFNLRKVRNKQFVDFPSRVTFRYFKLILPKVSYASKYTGTTPNANGVERLHCIAEFGTYRKR